MKSVELALTAGRKRQSPVTGFVHHCYENPDHCQETIPVYENFCFALALLRSRTVDNILEARALLEKLLAFEVGGHFPVYLHEFPRCRFEGLRSKLSSVIFYILRDFQTVLGESLPAQLQKLLEPGVQTPAERALARIHDWDPMALTFVGPQQQERGEPALTLDDLFMAEWSGKFPSRVLKDHPVHLQASLVFPCESSPFFVTPSHSLAHSYWGDGHPTHSLVFQTSGQVQENKNAMQVTLLEKNVEEEIEISFFCNLHPDHTILVNGQKATTFHLNDQILIVSKNLRKELIFRLESGEGKFWGHLLRGNRPGQLCCRGEERYEAYDHVIALRTVRRSLACCIRIDVITKQYEKNP